MSLLLILLQTICVGGIMKDKMFGDTNPALFTHYTTEYGDVERDKWSGAGGQPGWCLNRDIREVPPLVSNIGSALRELYVHVREEEWQKYLGLPLYY